MAHGKSLELQAFDDMQSWRPKNAERETVHRDRSLRGKARIKARKNANKVSREVASE